MPMISKSVISGAPPVKVMTGDGTLQNTGTAYILVYFVDHLQTASLDSPSFVIAPGTEPYQLYPDGDHVWVATASTDSSKVSCSGAVV